MTNEEIVILYQKANDKKYYSELLYKNNKNLIADISNHYRGYCEMEDLLQEGFFGLIKAAETFDVDKGNKFVTHAFICIKAHIQRYVEDNGNGIRIPGYQLSNIRKMNKAIDLFFKTHGTEPSVKELAILLKTSEAKVEQLLSDALYLSMKSCDEELTNETESLTIADTIPDMKDQIEDVENRIQNEQLKAILWGIVDKLPQAQKEVICCRYRNSLDANMIAARMNVTSYQVRKIEAKAYRELRRHYNIAKLRPFFNDSNIYSISIKYGGYGYFMNTWTSSPEMAVLMQEKREQ